MMRNLVLSLLLLPGIAQAAEVRVLTAGAYKAVVLAMAPAFEQASGHTLIVTNETAGGVQAKVRANEAIDVVMLPPAGAEALGALLVPGSIKPLARVGIGVAVRAGAPKPDIATVDAFRAAVVAARAPAWIDPAAGGSSGIYLSRLFDQWGIGAGLAPKAVLVRGGLVAEKLLSGEADLALQQLSELILPGVDVVGMLPAEIQNYTVYAGAIPVRSAQPEAAAALLAHLSGAAAPPVLQARGMSAP